MPPFRYDDPGPNRYAGTLIDLLRERGAIDADAATRIAGVRANADLRRGDLRAGMVRDLAAVPGQIVDATRQRAERERKQQLFVLGELSRVAVTSRGATPLDPSLRGRPARVTSATSHLPAAIACAACDTWIR